MRVIMSKEVLQEPGYHVQPTQPDHVLSIREFVGKTWQVIYPNEEAGVTREWIDQRVEASLQPEAIELGKQFIEKNANSTRMISRVALSEKGEVIGTAHGFIDDATDQYLGSLYVTEEYQGSGVADKLIAEIIAWSNPEEPLLVEVASYNERAKAFYRKWGFIETGRPIEPFVNVIPQIEMIRKGDRQ